MMRRRAIHPTESRLAASAVAAEVVVSSAFDGASCGACPWGGSGTSNLR